MQGSKTTPEYWDEIWTRVERREFDPRAPGLNNYVGRGVHRFLADVIAQSGLTSGSDVIEMGCGGSVWLPYFAKEFGFRPWGIDYSEKGCDRAIALLHESGVQGQVFCANFEHPLPELSGRFHLVCSFGVIEHFRDTSTCLTHFASYLRAGGFIITLIPNMLGLVGALQKFVSRAVYDIHVPLDLKALVRAHEMAGLCVRRSEYLLPIHLNVVNSGDNANRRAYQAFARTASWVSKTVWMLESVAPVFRPNRWTSPYLACVAQKT